MKILTTTGNQDIKLIFRPRINPQGQVRMEIRSRSSNKLELYTNVIPTENENYYNILITDVIKNDLVENNYFDLTVYDNNGTLLARETLFVTDQTIDQQDNDLYDPNKDKYKVVESSNEYIIL
jgi:hypothetical protein|tara:strand:+ start:565 stop:933 length:369 start_codon:yes stop_codon:yes gene_type:complete